MGARTSAGFPGFVVVSLTLFFVSGATALAYEVLWARMLSLQFGVSIFGVMLAVSAFMAGLGAGCLAGSRWITKNPLVTFAALEATVAMVAFSMPVFMGMIDGLVSKVGPDIGLSAWYWIQGASAFFVLFLPAVVLGATFPAMVKTLTTYVPIGVIYGINSLGGAMGALSPLVLLPALGWTVSNYAVGMIGLVVATTALVWRRRYKRADSGPREESTSADAPVHAARHDYGALLAYAGIGFAAITLQIAWARLFGMVFLRTEYVLAVLLCVFLVGIALGSFFGRVFSRPYWLCIFPSLSALFAVLSLWGLPLLARWMAEASFSSLTAAVWWQAGGIALLTLPVTLVLGAWFPLVTQRMRGTNDVAGPRLYTVNSFGAALGGLVAGIVFIPELGTPATVIMAALVLLVCGSAWANRRESLLFGLVIIALAWPVKKLPEVGVLLPSTMGETRDIYKFEDMVSITHVVEDPQGQRVLLGDLNRMEASSDTTAVVSQKNQARLPLLLHPQPQSILFLGLGTGISAAGSLPYPNLDRSVVELSAGAIAAAENYFGLVNEQVMGRMEVTRDDARRFLRRTTDRYDVIVGDLFHPDLVGRSALLSRQQFQRAKDRLNERGVFVQWLALNQFDLGALQVVLRTFKSVFPDAVMFLDGFKLAMVGALDGSTVATSALANMGRLELAAAEQATGAEGVWTWVGRYLGPIPLATSGVIQDELLPRIEFDLPRLRFAHDRPLIAVMDWLFEMRPPADVAADQLSVASRDLEEFERCYTATGLAMLSWVALLKDEVGESERLIRYAYSANPKDRWIGLDLADKMMATLDQAVAGGYGRRQALEKILAVRDDHEKALIELLNLERQAGNIDAATRYENRLRAISPLSHLPAR